MGSAEAIKNAAATAKPGDGESGGGFSEGVSGTVPLRTVSELAFFIGSPEWYGLQAQTISEL